MSKDSKQISLSALSHEIRNPLTLIQSSLQLLGQHHPEIREDPLWPQIFSDFDYITLLLTDLSAFDQSNCLNYTRVNLPGFFTAIIASFQSKAALEQKKLTLYCEAVPETFDIDSVKLREAVCNILKNAFEATQPADQITVVIKSCWNHLVITISDSGTGISETDLPNIFEPFKTSKSTGTGLGLPIAKRIIESHQGTIQICSRKNIGTKVVLVLPLQPSSKIQALSTTDR